MREKIQETIDIIETLPENVHGSAALAELRAWLGSLPAPAIDLETLCDGHDVTDKRRESLQLAADLGADRATLEKIRDAMRVSTRPRNSRDVPPEHPPEHYRSLPTIKSSHFDNLVEDTGNRRVWLSRMTVDDGAPEEEHVTVEIWNGHTWINVCHSRGNRWVAGAGSYAT